MPRVPFLEITEPSAQHRREFLADGMRVFGRLPTNDIVFADESVGDHDGDLEIHGEEVVVRETRRAIHLGKKRVERDRMIEGDVLRVGRIRMRLGLADAARGPGVCVTCRAPLDARRALVLRNVRGVRKDSTSLFSCGGCLSVVETSPADGALVAPGSVFARVLDRMRRASEEGRELEEAVDLAREAGGQSSMFAAFALPEMQALRPRRVRLRKQGVLIDSDVREIVSDASSRMMALLEWQADLDVLRMDCGTLLVRHPKPIRSLAGIATVDFSIVE